MLSINFKDGVGVTITSAEDFQSDLSIDCGDFFVNVYSGSIEDVDFNNALSMGNEYVIFNNINNRLGGILTA